MTRLRTCEGCARHVFVTETRCPFCQRELAPASRSPIFDLRASMSRAQRVALVAAVAGQTLLGCADDNTDAGLQTGTGGASAMQGSGGSTSMPGTGGKSGGASGGIAQPVYGAPIDPGTGGQGTGGMGNDGTGGVVAITHYGGIMPPVDAGTDKDASADAGDAAEPNDAGQDAGRVQALYGAPVPVYGAPIPGK